MGYKTQKCSENGMKTQIFDTKKRFFEQKNNFLDGKSISELKNNF